MCNGGNEIDDAADASLAKVDSGRRAADDLCRGPAQHGVRNGRTSVDLKNLVGA